MPRKFGRAGMIWTGALILVCLLGAFAYYRQLDKGLIVTNMGVANPAAAAERPIEGSGGFQLVLKQRYLLLIAVMVLLFSLVTPRPGPGADRDRRIW